MFTRFFKQVIALALVLITVLSLFPTSAVLAATGDIGTISFDFTYDSGGNAMRYNSSAVINGYTAGGTGDYKYRMYVDGEAAFCIQPGVPLHTGDTLKESSSATWNALSTAQKKAVGLALLYGYQGNKGNLTGSDDEKWLATQTLVWEFATGCRQATGSYKQTSTTVYQLHFGSNYANSGAKAAYDQIVGLLTEHDTIPSFMSESKTGITKELSYSGGKYTITLTDSNGALSDYTLSCVDKNVSITKSGNKLTVSVAAAIDGSARITATRNNVPTVSESAKLIAYGDANLQDVVTGVENADSVVAYINIETPTGTLALKKTSEDGAISGIQFTITGDNFEKTVKTGSDGTLSIDGLFPGTYTVTEASYDRYMPQKSQTVTITGGKTSTVSFSNVLKKWNVTVTKRDIETGNAQGNATLAGATYGIYKGDELIDAYTTDAHGQFTTSYYICGDNWSIREITESEGYLLNPESCHIGAEAKNYTVEYNSTANDVMEQVIKGNIQLVKHIDKDNEDVESSGDSSDGNVGIIEQPEAGAMFEVYLKSAGSFSDAKESEKDTLVTDENGYAKTKDLPYGIYIVHQVSGMEGQAFVPDFSVYIAQNGQTYYYILNNTAITAKIRIEKRDTETGELIAAEGAGFKILDSSKNYISMSYDYPTPTTIDTFFTNDEGWLMLPESLDYGNYYLEEVQAPHGYILNSGLIEFTVDGNDATVTVTKQDTPQKGKITVVKTGEVFSTVKESDGIYQPIYTMEGLGGAVYEIIAAENIYTLDGTLRAAEGEVVDTVTTDSGGVAVTDLLYLGSYYIQEVTAPDAYTLDSEAKKVELTYAGQEIEVTGLSSVFYNERQKVLIELTKMLEQEESFAVGTDNEIRNVSFGLYAAEELTAADGTAIPSDGLIEILYVDEDGNGSFTSDLPLGSYYVKEITTDNHYILSGEQYPVTFAYAGQDTALVTIAVNDGETIENQLIRGDIEGKKVDGEGNALEGALIGLFKADETEFTDKNALMTATSAEDGSFSFANVVYGEWVVREIKSPTGYVLNEKSYPAIISKNKQRIEIEIENSLIRGTVQLTKVDADYPDHLLTGAEFEVYTDTNGNKELDEADGLVGKLKEGKEGIYQLDDLLYGGYFVKEITAPEYFELDETPYYFSIENDGEIVVVETKAGAGFFNAAQSGALRITKTSDDDNIKGFSFLVEGTTAIGDKFSETYTTDEKGKIEIENLRIGTYTVSEISNDATAGYILPDKQEIKIKANETAELTFHNKLKAEKETKTTAAASETPKSGDSPKTGDDRQLPYILLFTSLAGILILGGYTAYQKGWFRKLKKKK